MPWNLLKHINDLVLSIPEYINGFEKRLPKVKNYGAEMSDDS